MQIEFLLAGLTDASGNPLAAGKVYAFEAGTDTPKTVYQDEELTNPHATPIVLDSLGKKLGFGSGLYKFEVYSADDELIHTFDDIALFARYSHYSTRIALASAYHAGTTAGSANAQTGSIPVLLDSYSDMKLFSFIAGNTNTTTAPTINLNGLGAVTMIQDDGQGLMPRAILAGGLYYGFYDGTNVRILNPTLLRENINSITAAGSNQGTATLLNHGSNLVGSADGVKGVICPTPIKGDFVRVFNNASANLLIYPHSGGYIGNSAQNASYSLPSSPNYKYVTLIAVDTARWYVSV